MAQGTLRISSQFGARRRILPAEGENVTLAPTGLLFVKPANHMFKLKGLDLPIAGVPASAFRQAQVSVMCRHLGELHRYASFNAAGTEGDRVIWDQTLSLRTKIPA